MDAKEFTKQIDEIQSNIDKLTESNKKGYQSLNADVDKLIGKTNAAKQAIKDFTNLQTTFNNNNANVYPQNTFSTTQFFDGSLSKDAFIREGNAIDTHFKLYARKVRGLQNQGINAYANPNNELTNNGSGYQNVNGFTGVGFGSELKQGILAQKWWAWWVVQLATIQKLAGLVDFETDDIFLKVQLYRAYQLAILSQAAVIEKQGDKYRIWCAYDVKYDEFQQPKTCKISDPDWFFTDSDIPKDDDDKLIDLKDNKYCYLQWDLNNYNIWFYTVFYTIDYVDILFIWLNRTFISRPIIFQQVGSTEASIQEAAQLINPMKTIIQVRTAGLEAALHQINKESDTSFSIENKYQYQQIGDANADAIYSSFPEIWLKIWDSILGIIPPSSKKDGARSISDEILPNETINKILQKKYGLTLDLFVKEVKDKWGIDIKYSLVGFDEHSRNPAYEKEQGVNNGKPTNTDNQ